MLKSDPLYEERGASALTIAIAMVVIMGMAAIAIDAAGFGFNERRQDQIAADVSVMAGVLEFQDQAQVVDQVLTFARDNLTNDYDDAEWQAIWQSCVDSDRPVDFEPLPDPWTPGATLDCISQSPSFLRVRIPDQEIETSFARVIGFDTLRTHAVAVATLQPSAFLNGLMPFAVRGGEGAGEICLQTGPLGISVEPCTGPDAGSFGAILSHWFGDDFYGTSPNCSENDLQGPTNATSILDDNIAIGIDHLIGVFDGDYDGDGSIDWTYHPWDGNESSPAIEASAANVDDCTIVDGTAVPTDGVPVDTVLIDVGNDLKDDVTRGLVGNETFVDGGPSRLQRGNNAEIDVQSGSQTWELDNKPLWEYLLPFSSQSGTPVPACNPNNFVTVTDLMQLQANNDQMVLCLQNHESTPGAGVIFSNEIADSPRFGWAPELWHDNLGNGNAWRPVHEYRMVYVAGTFFNCSGTTCGLTFYPGHPGPEPLCDPVGGSCRALVINQTTAFLLPNDTIPTPIQESFPIETLGPFQPRLWR